MKKVLTLILTFTVLAVSAQEKAKSQKVKKPKTVKTASGLEYTITEKGNGKKLQEISKSAGRADSKFKCT